MSDSILKVVDVHKAFSGVKALKGVNLDIKKGEVHCLAGENGCGKSTIIKIISGVYTLDAGQIEFDGRVYTHITPIEAIMNGVQVIYQDFSIFPNLSVMENLALNTALSSRKKIVNWRWFREIAQQAIDKINFKIDLDAIVGELSVADKQLVAICRALINNARLIIMDEPTTALTKKEVTALFKIVRDLQAEGISILFVSHKLDEVFEICTGCTIMRSGENVFTGNVAELDDKKFAYYMTGREFDVSHYEPGEVGETILEAKNISLKNAFYNIDFTVRRGEILGITGLLGSGRTELALALFGSLKPESGEIILNGNAARLSSIHDAINKKIGYCPEDRLTEGLFLPQSIGDNIVISKIDDYANPIGAINKNIMGDEINRWVKNLSIATKNPNNAAATLSGGNQQRIVLAKWLARDLDVLILNGPTVGVDIGSKYDIHELLFKVAKEGMSIIIISDDIPEVLHCCNRILVMKTGRIVAQLDTTQTNAKELHEIMSGANAEKEVG